MTGAHLYWYRKCQLDFVGEFNALMNGLTQQQIQTMAETKICTDTYPISFSIQ